MRPIRVKDQVRLGSRWTRHTRGRPTWTPTRGRPYPSFSRAIVVTAAADFAVSMLVVLTLDG